MTAVCARIGQWDAEESIRWDHEFETIAHVEAASARNGSLVFWRYDHALSLGARLAAGTLHSPRVELELLHRAPMYTLVAVLLSASNRGSESQRALTPKWCASGRLTWVYWLPVDDEWRKVDPRDSLHFDALRGPDCAAFYYSLSFLFGGYSSGVLKSTHCKVLRCRSGEGRCIQARINCL